MYVNIMLRLVFSRCLGLRRQQHGFRQTAATGIAWTCI